MNVHDKLLFTAVIAKCKRVTKAEILVSSRLGTCGCTVSYYFTSNLKCKENPVTSGLSCLEISTCF